MPKRDLICIGTSAGGVSALMAVVEKLPADLPAAVLVVLHLAADHPSVLPRILESAGKLPASHAAPGDLIRNGHIYIAPPDRHLLVDPGVLRVNRGPRENGHRPAVDALFRTAAHAYGPRVIGVILTGALDDGAAGLVSVKQRGGLALVQDPAEAFCPDMPLHALEVVEADYITPIAELGALLGKLVTADVSESAPSSALLQREAEVNLHRLERKVDPPGRPSDIACPSCGGVLNELEDGRMLRFRCRVGHAFAPESLYRTEQAAIESALWAGLRALEEQAALSRRMGERARTSRHPRSAARFEERADAADQQARLLREVLRIEDAREPA